MNNTNKKAVFFDLDHTLWDFEKNSALAFRTLFEKHAFDFDHDAFITSYIPINNRYWKRYRDDEITQQELRYGRLREGLAQVNFEVSDDLIHTLSEEYVSLLPQNNHLYEGAIEILDYLKPKYSLHIITNGFHEVQAGKLRNANIEHYFETVTNSDMAGCKKPHAGIFEFALKAANVEKCDAVMIGDCIEADVQGALDCGLDAIYFNEFRKETDAPVKQVYHLLDLKNLL